MSRGGGHRHSSNLALLWLWCGPATVTLIRPLARKLPCATGVALKSKKKKKENYFLIKMELCHYILTYLTLKISLLYHYLYNLLMDI